MILFADDTKLYRRIISDEDGHILQRDIDVLHAWSQIWLMEFNIGKCKSLHYGYGNAMREYTMFVCLFMLCDHVVYYAVPTIVRASLLLY